MSEHLYPQQLDPMNLTTFVGGIGSQRWLPYAMIEVIKGEDSDENAQHVADDLGDGGDSDHSAAA